MKLDAEECDIWILRLTIAFVVSNVWVNGAPVNVESTRTTAATLLGTTNLDFRTLALFLL
jgi:hypothetical protein